MRRALVDADVTPYSEATHAGLARYLQVVVERRSRSAQVVLVANSATVEPLASCLDLVRERLGDELHSLWFNSHCEPSNTILGPEFVNWCGPASVIEHFGGAAIHYPPGAFGQNNLDVAERIVEHVRAEVPEDACVAEFYAGVGAIGLSLLRTFKEPVPDVFRREVMDVIGASNTWRWIPYHNSFADVDGKRVASVSGGTRWGGGVWINAQDMARFGYLFLRGGLWKGRRIVPEKWIAMARTLQRFQHSLIGGSRRGLPRGQGAAEARARRHAPSARRSHRGKDRARTESTDAGTARTVLGWA